MTQPDPEKLDPTNPDPSPITRGGSVSDKTGRGAGEQTGAGEMGPDRSVSDRTGRQA
jgi:hypothetical protein